jgi:hypothetical protein
MGDFGMTDRYGVTVTGSCRICGHEGYTEMHHIISQARCRKLGREDWITNPGNIVELCKPCHDQTTASITSEINRGTDKRKKSKFRKNIIVEGGGDSPEQCWAMLKNGRKRCRKPNTNEGLCFMHHKTIRLGIPPHKSVPGMVKKKRNRN